MTEFKDFFAASVGAAARLIGLLFVAITVAPEKVFGVRAHARKRGQATAAFIALANVLFVSLAALIGASGPRVIVVVACAALFQIVRESVTMARLFPESRGRYPFGLIAMGIYLLELIVVVRLAAGFGTAHGLLYIVLGLYGYALGSSWSLLGARDANSAGVSDAREADGREAKAVDASVGSRALERTLTGLSGGMSE